jgi:hypothetical protein
MRNARPRLRDPLLPPMLPQTASPSTLAQSGPSAPAPLAVAPATPAMGPNDQTILGVVSAVSFLVAAAGVGAIAFGARKESPWPKVMAGIGFLLGVSAGVAYDKNAANDLATSVLNEEL